MKYVKDKMAEAALGVYWGEWPAKDFCLLPGCGYKRAEHGPMELGPRFKADHFYVGRVEDIRTV